MKNFRAAFTLIEMLIVVVVLVTLMSVTFRLMSVGDSQTRVNTTINRLQRIENCLSGYYAAFGTYPPVKLHGSRDYNQKVNNHGIQTGDEQQLVLDWYKEDSSSHGIGSTTEKNRDWPQVEAACRSQPFAARFPYPPGMNEVIEARAEIAKELLDDDASEEEKAVAEAGYDDGYTENSGRHDLNETDWTESQLFQFGLMSYVLPRYLIMMNGDEEFFRSGKQWQANNTLPAKPLGKGEKYASWADFYQEVNRARGGNKESFANIRYIPSQAVSARWMANLEDSCYVGSSVETKYTAGIQINGGGAIDGIRQHVFAPGGRDSNSTKDQYVLDMITMVDGWYHELYYYSPAPYQSYTVWSAGANGRTFPPWASRDGFTAKQNQAIGAWIDDDIVHMSN